MPNKEPLLTEHEKSLFKMALEFNKTTIKDFAASLGYSDSFIRGVLNNSRTSAYARLSIRNYINENRQKLLEFVDA